MSYLNSLLSWVDATTDIPAYKPPTSLAVDDPLRYKQIMDARATRPQKVAEAAQASRQALGATQLSGKVKELLGKSLGEAAQTAGRHAQWVENAGGAMHPLMYGKTHEWREPALNYMQRNYQAFMDGTGPMQDAAFKGAAAVQGSSSLDPSSNTFDQAAAGAMRGHMAQVASELGAKGLTNALRGTGSTQGFEVQQAWKQQQEQNQKTADGLLAALKQLMGAK